jgi:hypothetical protein
MLTISSVMYAVGSAVLCPRGFAAALYEALAAEPCDADASEVGFLLVILNQ